MKLKELIEKLEPYNPEADVCVMANNRDYPFTLAYGSSEGVTPETASNVSFCVDELNTYEVAG